MSAETYPKVYLYKRLVQAKLFIDAEYASPMDLDNIADEALLSKYHFIRLFKKTYGYTPHQYLTAVRLDRAKDLLREGRPVTDVCYAVGFDSLSSFTGLFKRLTGKTPSVFRQQDRALRTEMHEAPLSFVPHCFASAHGWGK